MHVFLCISMVCIFVFIGIMVYINRGMDCMYQNVLVCTGSSNLQLLVCICWYWYIWYELCVVDVIVCIYLYHDGSV